MPLYEYKCDNCGHTQEVFLPMSRRNEKVDTLCEKCSGGRYKRALPTPRFQFVGDGFDSTRLSQDQIDMTPEFWEDDPVKPKVKFIK